MELHHQGAQIKTFCWDNLMTKVYIARIRRPCLNKLENLHATRRISADCFVSLILSSLDFWRKRAICTVLRCPMSKDTESLTSRLCIQTGKFYCWQNIFPPLTTVTLVKWPSCHRRETFMLHGQRRSIVVSLINNCVNCFVLDRTEIRIFSGDADKLASKWAHCKTTTFTCQRLF